MWTGRQLRNARMRLSTFPTVPRRESIPMQLIHWETRVIDCGHSWATRTSIHSCLRAESGPAASSWTRPFTLPSKAKPQIGISMPFLSKRYGPCCATALVKDIVGQSDFRAGVIAVPAQVAARVGPSPRNPLSCRRHRRPQGLAKIRQITKRDNDTSIAAN